MATDEHGTPLPYASVALSDTQKPSEARKTIFTDEDGKFGFSAIEPGNYLLEINTMGHNTYERELQVGGDMDLGTIVLATGATTLEAVSVIAPRKVLERRSDRFVLNVSEGTFEASNVLEMFMALPFMEVQGESFSIHGKRNILVLLDNVQMPGMTVSQVLSTMTGSEIDRIEFITTPSARYDAAVDAVIHIHTKKGQGEGWTGNAVANYSQGQYGIGNVGINATYRKGKWALGTRYNYRAGNNLVDLGGYRSIAFADRSLAMDNNSTELYRNRYHTANVNLSYDINTNHQLHVNVGWMPGKSPNSEFTGESGFSTLPHQPADSILLRKQDVEYRDNTQNYSVNYQGKLDTLGKSISLIATYTPVRSDNYNETLFQEMRLPDGTLLNSLPIIRNENPSKADIWILQNDWELPFQNDWQIEAGAKYSRSRNHTETLQFERTNGSWQALPDYTFDNRFYEDIVAAYAGVQKKMGNTTLRASLRAEHTVMGVHDLYERNFFDLFPNIMLQQKWGERTIMLNYRKSINRPGFNQIAPWRLYLDEYQSVEGNINLRPAYIEQIVLNGNIMDNLFLELEYGHFKGLISQFPRQEGEGIVFSLENADRSEMAVNMSYEYRFTSWWSGNAFARGYRWAYDAHINREDVSNQGYAYNFGVTGSFKLPAAITLDANYSYYSPAANSGYEYDRRNYARVALRKSFMEDRLRLTAAVNDIFMGTISRTTIRGGNMVNYFHNYYDSQRVSLGLVFTFGKKTVKAVESQKLGNEDLINRAGG